MKRSHLVFLLAGALLAAACGTVKQAAQQVSQEVGSSLKDLSESISSAAGSAINPTSVLQDTDVKGVRVLVLSDIGSKTLTQDETKQLDALAKEIKARGNCQVSVFGHSDITGSSEVNDAVSRQRARLVADYLKGKGVSNISSQGMSYNHPVAGNDTAAGRARNRRVEVFVSTVGKYNPYK